MHCGQRARYQRCSGCGRSQLAAVAASDHHERGFAHAAELSTRPRTFSAYRCDDLIARHEWNAVSWRVGCLLENATNWFRGMLRVVESIRAVAPRAVGHMTPAPIVDFIGSQGLLLRNDSDMAPFENGCVVRFCAPNGAMRPGTAVVKGVDRVGFHLWFGHSVLSGVPALVEGDAVFVTGIGGKPW